MTEREALMRLRATVARWAIDGKRHIRSDRGEDADLHVGAEVRELLTGDIDGSNKIFYSSRVPIADPAAIPVLSFRGLTYTRGNGFAQAGIAWWFDEAPSTEGFTDARPFVMYRCDPRAPVTGFDALIMRRPTHAPKKKRLFRSARPRVSVPIL